MASYKTLLISLLVCGLGFSQSDTLNQLDTEGKRQGYWVLRGADSPDKKFCDTCKMAEGVYIKGRKN
jgi:hypothetical protein